MKLLRIVFLCVVQLSVQGVSAQLAQLGNFIWEDTNGNGCQDAGEPGIPNATIQIFGTDENGNPVNQTTTSDVNGFYLFEGLAPGTYELLFTGPSQFLPTFPLAGADRSKDSDCQPNFRTDPFPLVAGEINLTCDAGFYNPATLTSFIWNDLNGNGIQNAGEPGIPGVQVMLFGTVGPDNSPVTLATATNGSGLALFNQLAPGNYRISVVQPAPGWPATANDQGPNDATDSDIDPVTHGTPLVPLRSGDQYVNLDAGWYQTAEVGNFVWEDLDGNGRQGAGEPGIPNVDVTLTGTNGVGAPVILTRTTDAAGIYQFANVLPGTYRLTVASPGSQYVVTSPNQGVNDGLDSDIAPGTQFTGNFSLVSGQIDKTLDAGFYRPASMSCFVWNDLNKDGIQDAGEPGIPNLNAQLSGNTGDGTAVSLQVNSGPGGNCVFNNLTPGSYRVTFDYPPGCQTASDKDQGGNDLADSDIDPITRKTALETLISAENNTTYDAGFYEGTRLSLAGSHCGPGMIEAQIVSSTTFPVQYSWESGAGATGSGSASSNPFDIIGLFTQTYTVTTTDAAGCSATATTTVFIPTPIIITTTVTDVSCFNGLNGSALMTVSGGSSPYTFLWSDGSTQCDIFGIAAGIYTVTVTDATGCTQTASVNISQPPAFNLSVAVNNVLCFGGSNGAINLSVSGGTPGYSYTWSNGASTQDIFNIVSGTYTVTVTDTHGCTNTKSTIITQPVAMNLTVQVFAAQCFGLTTGAINLTALGGTPDYTYLWSNNATTQDQTGLIAGTYTVTVTDANNCTKTLSATITQPSQLTAIGNVTNVSCYGGSDGKIDLTVTGSVPPYRYDWSNDGPENPDNDTQDLIGLTAGIYTVTVTDANTCTTTHQVTLAAPQALTIILNSLNPPTCYGGANGSIDISVTGGKTPYMFDWDNDGAENPDNDPQDLINVPANSYTVTITDANGCSQSATYTVTQPDSMTITGALYPVPCGSGASVGAIDLTVTGGAAGYIYDWSNDGPENPDNDAQDLASLTVGIYTVSVTDANGCLATKSFNIHNETPMSPADFSIVPATCSGGSDGSITLPTLPPGATAPLTFNWSGANGFSSSAQNINDLSPGAYSLTLLDATGCNYTATLQLGFISVSVQLDLQAIDITCAGACDGGLNLTASGGSLPYQYLWSNGSAGEDLSNLCEGTYSVTVIDLNGCSGSAEKALTTPALLSLAATPVDVKCAGSNTGSVSLNISGGTPPYTSQWSTGATTQSINLLSPGDYAVTISDLHNCSATASATVNEPPALVLTETHVNIACFGANTGSVDLSVAGGIPPYTYDWSNDGPENPDNDTQDQIGFSASTYTVTVTDAANCTKTLSVTLNQPPAIALSTTQVNVLCNGTATGSVDLTVTGGVAPYTYHWNNNFATQDLSSLTAGTYCVTVTDNNGCTKFTCVTIAQPTSLVITETHASPNCNSFDGYINLIVSGGVSPYTYIWSNGTTTQNVSNLAAGTYSVTVTDANNCTKTLSTTLNSVDGPAISVTQSNISCKSGSDGFIHLTLTGGNGPFSFDWSNDGPEDPDNDAKDISDLPPGIYVVTVTDAAGCTNTASIALSEPALITIQTIITPSCTGTNSGRAQLTVSGGTAPYIYYWSDGSTVEDRTGLLPGTYDVTVIDLKGCMQTASIEITLSPAVILSGVTTDIPCNGANSGAIDLTVSGGTPPFTYDWSKDGPETPDNDTEDLFGLPVGFYNITVTDQIGCAASASYQVRHLGFSPCGRIQGYVFHDTQTDCQSQGFEPGLGNWLVRAEGLDTLYGVTLNNGEFYIAAPAGSYTVRVFPPNPLWQQCVVSGSATLATEGDTVSAGEFPMQGEILCPAMAVNIGTSQLRRCNSNNYYQVDYRNDGTLKAENAYIDVQIDPFLSLISANKPYSVIGNNLFRFNVGDVEIGGSGQFTLRVQVSCDAALGQTHCTEAHIYPDDSCLPTNPDWSGASLRLGSRCLSDSLKFSIKNTGIAQMAASSDYIVIEDAVMLMRSSVPPLPPGDSIEIALPANGSTWRLEVEQEPYHPYPASPSLSVEGCTTGSNFSTGYINQFPTFEPTHTEDVDCMANIGSYDPNNKHSYPIGYGAEHYIRPGTDLEYLIRFQNTGTDTAFRVEIIDTLSMWLDPTTIRPGASSHPYRFDMNGGGVAHFIFDPISLPDSNVNAITSQGFVRFSIQPIAAAPLETIILNTADIYFDYNGSVGTNTTYLRLGEEFIKVGVWTPRLPEIGISILPNPFEQEAVLQLSGIREKGEIQLMISSLQGNTLHRLRSDNGEFILHRNDWPAGAYLFGLYQNGRLIGSGKLVVD